MKPNPLPSLEILNERLNYDPDTGLFTWKKKISNNIPAGSVAGSLQNTGYICISINYISYLAHRLAYKMCYGFDPLNQVDHIDSDRKNNRISNLRDATNSENGRNQKKRKNNTSGFKGVFQSKLNRKNPWRAEIKYNGKGIHLGLFKTKEEAALAYEQAAKKYFGEFARTE